MTEDKRSKHTVFVDKRQSITMTGVLDVISFDEEAVIAETELGVLVLNGTNLHVNRLNLENGELSVEGEIHSMNYEEPSSFTKGRAGFLSKLFK